MGDDLVTLKADELARDPRVARAKQLLREALTEHQRTLTGIRPADPALKQSHDETISAEGWSIARATWPSRTVASRHSDRIVPTAPVRISLLRSG